MYKEIFKSGVNDKSLAAAGEYALVKVMSSIRYNEIRRNQLIINESWIKLKESLKIKPIVKVPTAELHIIHKDGSRDIKHYPTKSDSYDGSKINNLYINDEMGKWENDQNRITDEMGQANFHKQWKPKKSDSMSHFIDSKRQYETIKAGGWLNPKFMDMFNPIFNLSAGIDPYDINDKESKSN